MASLIAPDRWRTLESLIDRALDIAPEHRGEYFATVSGGDVRTRTELERLVEECERPEPSLDGAMPQRFPSLFEDVPIPPHSALGERFRIDRELGRGGMSTVYLARDLKHERDVAIKVLHPELAAVLGAERFVSEIRVTANLRHSNILPLFDSGESEGTLYYVMPFVDGESLRARLERERQLSVPEAVRIAREVGSALEAAHRQGVVHRDIKPENILLQDGRVFVVDFGISLALTRAGATRMTHTGLALGTPQYMSPEQASGQRQIDERTDIYSLGAVLYEMLAGEPPFTGATPQAVVAKMMSSEAPSVRRIRPTVSDALDAAIRTALAPVPADRFASVAELTRALDQDQISVPASPPRALPRTRWIALGAATLVLGAAGAFAVSRASRTEQPLIDRRVLVVPFENRTGSKELDALGDAAADNLRSQLVAAHLADVVDLQGVGELPRNASAQALGRLARDHGAARVLRGSYYRQGDSVRFEPQILDSRTGEFAETVLPVVVPLAAPSVASEMLRQRVLAVFVVLTDTGFDVWQLASHPATYDAYLEFRAGMSVDPGRHQEMTFEHLRRAYALDTNFVQPLLSLASFGGCEMTDSIVERIGRRLERLPIFDRTGLTRQRASCRGEGDVEMNAARELYAAAPKSNVAAKLFARSARHHNYFREAIAAVERLDRTKHRRSIGYWGSLVMPYHLLGMRDRELAATREARRFIPDNWEVMMWEARALTASGHLVELRALLDTMESVPANSDQVGSALVFMRLVGRELRVHGHPEEAQRVLERVIARLHSVAARDKRDQDDRLEELVAYYDAGHWAEATAVAQQAMQRDSTNMELRTLVAAMAARRGDRRTVDRTDAWLSRIKGPYEIGIPSLYRARLAAVLGDRDRADTLFRRALDEGYFVTEGVGPHDEPDFAPIRDMPGFKLLYRDKSCADDHSPCTASAQRGAR